ncbi:sensor histidine kinase [Flavobacterium sp. RHBU_3]|uniref:sensor histidine kinase n=1 Tax=Flavobacterium sp. RHBU_3 TaxID=3391184 RepID=UPI003984DD27
MHKTTQEVNKSDLLEAAFNAADNRCVIFTAVREKGVVTDFEFTILSPATIKLMGKDITGQRISELAQDYRDLLPEMIKVLNTGITHEWERCVDYLTEEPAWFKVTDSKASDDVLVRQWEDITVKKNEEKYLQEEIARKAEEKYLSLFNATEQGFCIIEMVFDENQNPSDYIFLDYNPAFEKQTGLKNAKGISMKTLAPNHEQHWFDIYGNVARTGKPINFEQTSSELLDGGWYEVSAFPLTGEKDNRVGIIFNDVTTRKKAEKQLEEFNKALEEEVKDRTARLDETNYLLELKNNELAETNKELESFTYIASHDLQEPLRKLQTFVNLLEERIHNPEQAALYLKRIYTSAGRMSNLINDILQYSRLSARVTFAPVHLNEVIATVISDLELDAPEKEISLTIEDLPEIEGVKVQLQQLFSNLLSNSVKYCDKKPKIHISSKHITENNRDKVQIRIQDNGIGFDNKFASQIFDLFKRLHGKSEYEGTGIGLSICKKIAERHSGNISAEALPQGGALFIVTLPLKQIV